MYKVIMFGGTTESRALADKLQALGVSTLQCVATDYGSALQTAGRGITTLAGRMDEDMMRALIERERPVIVIDATHPYAHHASRNIRLACEGLPPKYIRVARDRSPVDGCALFTNLQALVDWLNTTAGNIFAAMGAKHARAFTHVCGFQERVYLRLLPTVEGLAHCLKLGYLPAHLVLMQGPFSRELNAAMFKETGARVLVTKESGTIGGYPEKLAAARELHVQAAVLARPEDRGYTLGEALTFLEEL
ncbi:MAG: precorrin-6A reductase [Clostridiales bacterium]|jgi:precorrin-6x reductase|nr:precorrin-6A reductase [Clostridiales bacterium]